MNIVYAAEKNSIASLLSDFIDAPVAEGDIAVIDNPDETGSFYIGHRLGQFCLTPSGKIRLGRASSTVRSECRGEARRIQGVS